MKSYRLPFTILGDKVDPRTVELEDWEIRLARLARLDYGFKGVLIRAMKRFGLGRMNEKLRVGAFK